MTDSRKDVVDIAKAEFSESIANIISRHRLTYREIFSILADEMKDWADYVSNEEVYYQS